MPSIDEYTFKAQVTEELAVGKSFRFKTLTAPVGLFVLSGLFGAPCVLMAAFLDVLANLPSFVSILALTGLFLFLGIRALGGYVEIAPTHIEWKMIGKPHDVAFNELQAYAMVQTVSTKGGVSYSCRVYMHSGKHKNITCSGLRRDRPLPKKMKGHNFVMSLIAAYLNHAGVPRYTGPL